MNRRDFAGFSLAAIGGIFVPKYERWFPLRSMTPDAWLEWTEQLGAPESVGWRDQNDFLPVFPGPQYVKHRVPVRRQVVAPGVYSYTLLDRHIGALPTGRYMTLVDRSPAPFGETPRIASLHLHNGVPWLKPLAVR